MAKTTQKPGSRNLCPNFLTTPLCSYLESGPLLPSPWYRSQFLSHAYDLLSDREEFTYMTEYMNMTEGLGQYAEGLRKGCLTEVVF